MRWVKDCQFGGKRRAKTRWAFAGQCRCLFSGNLTGIEFERAGDEGRRLGGTIVCDRGHLSYLAGDLKQTMDLLQLILGASRALPNAS